MDRKVQDYLPEPSAYASLKRLGLGFPGAETRLFLTGAQERFLIGVTLASSTALTQLLSQETNYLPSESLEGSVGYAYPNSPHAPRKP